jgi:hypothetical protein
MYGTLRGALAGRKIAFDRDSYKATVEGRIVGVGKTIRIRSMHVHYDLTVPPEAVEATERALAVQAFRSAGQAERGSRFGRVSGVATCGVHHRDRIRYRRWDGANGLISLARVT